MKKKKEKKKKRKMQMRKVTEKFNGGNITSVVFLKTRLTKKTERQDSFFITNFEILQDPRDIIISSIVFVKCYNI